MYRSKRKSLILVAVLVGVLVMSAAETQAGWRHWGYWGCCPAYTCYSPYCGGWYLGIRPGPIRRWVFGPYRWYYGGYGCGWGCGYCGSCCWDCCCCYDPCCTVTTYDTITPAPAPAQPTPAPLEEPAPAPPQIDTPLQPLEPESTDTQTQSPVSMDSGLLTIRVPEAAKVFINGYQTKSTGTLRQYVSRGLKPGLTYKYEVRAEMIRDGRPVEDIEVVYLTAGAAERLAFSFDSKAEERLATLW